MSPVAKNFPQGLTDKLLTWHEWPLYSTETYVGNGFNSLALGMSGISELAATFTFFLITQGHKYKSKHLSNVSLIRFWYKGTFLNASKDWGSKLYMRSSSSNSYCSFFSSSSSKYSLEGL